MSHLHRYSKPEAHQLPVFKTSPNLARCLASPATPTAPCCTAACAPQPRVAGAQLQDFGARCSPGTSPIPAGSPQSADTQICP